MPTIGQGAFANTTKGEAAPAPAPLPTVDEVLDRYIQALGGRAAIEKIESRVAKLTLLRPKLINSGTPDAAMITRGESWQMEVWQKAPDKYLAVITTPSGVIQQGFNGVSGWVQTAEGQRAMSSAAVAQVRRQADLRAELKLKERYSALKVIGRERVGAHDTYVIEAASPNQRKEKLYFDVQSGLLLRRVALSETILGDDPEQTDYEDYREVGGVKLPFTIIVSFLDDSHYGTTRRYAEIKHNAPVDDARFNPPAAAK